MDADGSHQKQLTRLGSTTYGAAWSPDGKYIAFTSTHSGTDEVYVMNADGSNIKRLTTTSYFEDSQPKAYNRDPAWSPDGQQIAFASARSGNLEIYVMNADGSEPRQLTESEGVKVSPSWSPDGSRLAFLDGGSIFVMDADGTNVRKLTTTSFYDSSPTWSPDGQFIAYSLYVDKDFTVRPLKAGHQEIFVAHVATGQSIRLTKTQVNNEWPSWKA